MKDLTPQDARKLAAAWLSERGHDPDARNVVGEPLAEIVLHDGVPVRIQRAVLSAFGLDIADFGQCPRCGGRLEAKPVFLSPKLDAHICDECWQQDRHEEIGK